MTVLANLFTVVAVCAGVFFFLAGTLGLIRLPDAVTRLHALAKADGIGLALVVLGLLPQAGSVLAALKLVAIWLLAQVASATVSQLLAEVAGAAPAAGDAAGSADASQAVAAAPARPPAGGGPP